MCKMPQKYRLCAKKCIKAEQEQELIKDSVHINWKAKKASAYLALCADPKLYLTDNRSVALRRLQNVCRKYGG